MKVRLVEFGGGFVARDGARAYFLAETCQSIDAPEHVSDALLSARLRCLNAWPLGWTQAEAVKLLSAMLVGGV